MAEIIHDFLDNWEVALFREMAATSSAWTAGRQKTGYEVLDIKKKHPGGPGNCVARALARVGYVTDDLYDVYLIRYQQSHFIPKHKDAAGMQGKRHRRLNALVTRAKYGGDLWIDNRRIDLEICDAVLFYPDDEEHEVTAVHGTRLLFSVGAWIDVP